jgi:hypothetical protein
MDDQVRAAMLRWPDVPAAFGWLRLDRRGHWYLIDRGVPGFDEARDGDGSRITNSALIEFISRNYVAQGDGRWFFQNGPQRVYVDLDFAPLVLRVFDARRGNDVEIALVTHCGVAVGAVEAALCDPAGNVYLQTDAGPGIVHDNDLAALFGAGDSDDQVVQIGRTRLVLRAAVDPAQQLGFVRRPR